MTSGPAQSFLQQPVDKAQISRLLSIGKTELLPKFISKKTGRPFKAYLALGKDGKITFEFEPRAAKGKKGAAKATREPPPKIDFTGQEPLGKCPKCGGRVFESETHYLCEKSQASEKPCKFRSGKVVLQQPVDREQLTKLLTTSRTDLLPKFVSKGGRPFAAYLILDETGKVSFEFASPEMPA